MGWLPRPPLRPIDHVDATYPADSLRPLRQGVLMSVSEAAVEAAATAMYDSVAVLMRFPTGWDEAPDSLRDSYRGMARAALPAIRADIAAEVLAPIEALIETDGVFLKKDTKIKRVQEDRRRDLGAIVTTSMVTVDDIRAALSTAKEASE
jgi:hypothetical protein